MPKTAEVIDLTVSSDDDTDTLEHITTPKFKPSRIKVPKTPRKAAPKRSVTGIYYSTDEEDEDEADNIMRRGSMAERSTSKAPVAVKRKAFHFDDIESSPTKDYSNAADVLKNESDIDLIAFNVVMELARNEAELKGDTSYQALADEARTLVFTKKECEDKKHYLLKKIEVWEAEQASRPDSLYEDNILASGMKDSNTPDEPMKKSYQKLFEVNGSTAKGPKATSLKGRAQNRLETPTKDSQDKLVDHKPPFGIGGLKIQQALNAQSSTLVTPVSQEKLQESLKLLNDFLPSSLPEHLNTPTPSPVSHKSRSIIENASKQQTLAASQPAKVVPGIQTSPLATPMQTRPISMLPESVTPKFLARLACSSCVEKILNFAHNVDPNFKIPTDVGPFYELNLPAVIESRDIMVYLCDSCEKKLKLHVETLMADNDKTRRNLSSQFASVINDNERKQETEYDVKMRILKQKFNGFERDDSNDVFEETDEEAELQRRRENSKSSFYGKELPRSEPKRVREEYNDPDIVYGSSDSDA